MLPNTNLIFWAQGAAGVPLATIVETEWIGFKELAQENSLPPEEKLR